MYVEVNVKIFQNNAKINQTSSFIKALFWKKRRNSFAINLKQTIKELGKKVNFSKLKKVKFCEKVSTFLKWIRSLKLKHAHEISVNIDDVDDIDID